VPISANELIPMNYRHLLPITVFLSFTLLIFLFPGRLSGQATGKFRDPRDRNTYRWVRIGKQVWMAENLRLKTKTGSWDFKDDTIARKIFGKLYSWETARRACPKGWHLPSDNEWAVLVDSAGGSDHAGGNLKATDFWKAPNKEATNSTGFTALPGGYRYSEPYYADAGSVGYFWTSTENDADFAFYRCLSNGSGTVLRYSGKKDFGLSVRCVRDH
jgi:uncharacterized protein (TIGR02145 family)